MDIYSKTYILYIQLKQVEHINCYERIHWKIVGPPSKRIKYSQVECLQGHGGTSGTQSILNEQWNS